MKSVQLLDASLRDGGHRTNFHFTDEVLEKVLDPLDRSGVEFIEIGYRNGSLHAKKHLERAERSDKHYLKLCRSLVKKSGLAVMVHPKNVTAFDLLELHACGVDLLRICIEKNALQQAVAVLAQAQTLGLKTSFNFIHITHYKDHELDAIVHEAAQHHPDIIYFADSNGSILPHQIKAIYQRYTTQYPIPFGFHAHDNLGLAQANAIAAIETGALFIDASLAGMGKGTGNLKTEFFIAYLQANQVQKYDLQEALTAANYVRSTLGIGQEAIEMDEFIRGISDLSTADLKDYYTNQAEPFHAHNKTHSGTHSRQP